jgi:hypothetical protein
VWWRAALIAAAAPALAGGVTAFMAIFRKGERSVLMSLPLAGGGFALLLAISILPDRIEIGKILP